MLNAEKFRTEILWLVENDRNIAVTIEEGIVTGCGYIHCDHCLFKKYNGKCCKARCEWLVSEYKKPILDNAEREYLSHLCTPFEVVSIKKCEILCRVGGEHIKAERITVSCKFNGIGRIEYVSLPAFKPNTMYKGMEPDKEYTPQELGVRCKNNPHGDIKHG